MRRLPLAVLILGCGALESLGCGASSDPVAETGPTGGPATAPPCGRLRTEVPVASRTLFVAVDGADSGDGSEARPFASISGARASLRPGDALLLRAGTYRPKSTVFLEGLKGTAAAWIRIAAAPGAKVTLDGSAAAVESSAALLTVSNSSYVLVEGLEVTGGSSALVHVEESDHVTVRDLRLHGAKREGLLLLGSELVAEDNEIWDVATINTGGTMGGGWPGGIDTFHRKGFALTTNLTIRRNRVHDVWGECIIAAFVDGVTVVDNTVADCYSTGIYGDHARNVRIERNLVSVTSATRDIEGSPMTGVDFMVEKYGGDHPGPFPTEHVVVANNVVARVGTAFGWYADFDAKGNSYRDLVFAHNVVFQGKDAAFRFRKPGAAAGAAGPVRIVGNIIVAPMAYDVRGAPITATGNCYEVEEIGDLVDSKAVLGPCGLAAPALPLVFESFRLTPGSKARAAGAPAPEVPFDAFCAGRSKTAPSIGVAE